MGLQYRCTKRRSCGVRRTLKMPIDWYKYKPTCPGCKRDTLAPVYEKERERSSKRGCFCQGPFWPHNRGYLQDPDHICIHVPTGRVESFFLAWDMDGQITELSTKDDCPF